jgi:hypothetical protein
MHPDTKIIGSSPQDSGSKLLFSLFALTMEAAKVSNCQEPELPYHQIINWKGKQN